MALELLGGLVAEELHAVPALDERLPLRGERRSSSTERISSLLFLLAAPLRLLVVVELPFDLGGGAVEDVDGRPEQNLEVGFEAGVGGEMSSRERRRHGHDGHDARRDSMVSMPSPPP